MTPWEHHPALARDRLVAIAHMIHLGRNDALDRFNPNVGSTSWTLGCEAFAFQKHQILRASERLGWLEIVDPSMQFVFSVGGVPVRFYRGEPDDPNERTLKQSFSELRQLLLFTSEELVKLTPEPLYRFAVETDVDGCIAAITFVVLAGQTPVLIWQVPMDGPVTKVAPLRIEGSDGVNLPPARARIAARKRKQDGEAG